tara:strand:- start:2146 stop:2337 length:192 start_codon:yes stop_codon:yes gene_type:complete
MQCEILTSFAGVMGSFSAGDTAEIDDQFVAELAELGWVKPAGKAKKRKAIKPAAEVPAGEGDD